MPKGSSDLSAVFRALSHPTRRGVVERLGWGPASTSELATSSDMALPSFLQHLAVLEEAGLVDSHKQGRIRKYRVVPEATVVIDSWLASQQRLWKVRLDQFDQYVQALEGIDE